MEMTIAELTKRIVDEGLEEFAFIKFGTLSGPDYSACIGKNDDESFSVIFYGERGDVDAEYLNIPEAEACEIIYKYAVSKKRFEMAYREKKNNNQGMSLH